MKASTKRLIKRFEDAVRAEEMKGMYLPEDRARIEQEYEQAKKALVARIHLYE